MTVYDKCTLVIERSKENLEACYNRSGSSLGWTTGKAGLKMVQTNPPMLSR